MPIEAGCQHQRTVLSLPFRQSPFSAVLAPAVDKCIVALNLAARGPRQPNIDIKLYLAAPDEKYTKFKKEVPRPTFASRTKPLHTVCRFLPYSQLCQRLEKAKDFLSHLKPDFIDDIISR